MAAQGLPPYKAQFLKTCISGGALLFGDFELKSGRVSPYFFNFGAFYRADLLASVAHAFASAIHAYSVEHDLQFDVVFGPAYKGIPLAVAAVTELARMHPTKYGQLCYSYDRKEIKDHGEGGKIVGASLKGNKVLIVDDVVTAGSAKREAIQTIRAQGGEVVAVVVALDRMEAGDAPANGHVNGHVNGHANDNGDDVRSRSAMTLLREEFGIPMIAVLTLDDIIDGMGEETSEKDFKSMTEYRNKHRAC
ncbi:orotate phosphoribosyltransferase [Exophiala viscosa]|uniref:Orotate phosphoribosyltransferase n=1 Tax=Exophiala viscosa TaxID=2486360 RepID=A0AAN6IG99_9EURO|nr:orotate phosphoribosyltransferase [Exophiala viscosa]